MNAAWYMAMGEPGSIPIQTWTAHILFHLLIFINSSDKKDAFIYCLQYQLFRFDFDKSVKNLISTTKQQKPQME
jgi:hypothetical protein